MSLKFSNFGKAQIASAPSGTTGLAFTVEAGKGLLFPSLGGGDYFYGIFKDASGNREIVKITARSTDAMTIATGGRGLDGTTARTWAAGDYFVAGITNVALTESLANTILSALGGVTAAADKVPYFTGASTATVTTMTAFARTLLAGTDAADMRNILGAAGAAFGTGTSMLFYNASAPLGWTHDTTASLDHALRVVPGASIGGASGGTINFATAFTTKTVAGSNSATTLIGTQIPIHGHSYLKSQIGGGLGNGGSAPGTGFDIAATTGNAGGGLSHNHTFTGTSIDLRVKYMNVIIATKD